MKCITGALLGIQAGSFFSTSGQYLHHEYSQGLNIECRILVPLTPLECFFPSDASVEWRSFGVTDIRVRVQYFHTMIPGSIIAVSHGLENAPSIFSIGTGFSDGVCCRCSDCGCRRPRLSARIVDRRETCSIPFEGSHTDPDAEIKRHPSGIVWIRVVVTPLLGHPSDLHHRASSNAAGTLRGNPESV